MDDILAKQVVIAQLEEALGVHKALLESPEIQGQLVSWAEKCSLGLSNGGIVFFSGNGGSFADAQHLAAELTGKMGRLRAPLAGIALGTNGSGISAIGNDFGYEFSFAREFAALYRPNSIVITLTTSGNSANVLELVSQALMMEVPVLALTGADGGKIQEFCETIRVPSNRTERIQEMHILLGHTLCLLIEEYLGICGSDSLSC